MLHTISLSYSLFIYVETRRTYTYGIDVNIYVIICISLRELKVVALIIEVELTTLWFAYVHSIQHYKYYHFTFS